MRPSRMFVMGLVLIGIIGIWNGGVWADDSPPVWPTLHRDYQRSGYTDEIVTGPYERKWFRDFHTEMIASRVEAILAESLCFVGTFAGNLYALDVTNGKTVWRFSTNGPIGHSPCYDGGRVYFGSDDGYLYCVQATNGKELWRYRAQGGVWVAPACDGDTVYFGDRAGMFQAVDARTGKRRWSLPTGYMILTPASFSPDQQKILFASEDMHVYCVSGQGKLLWRSPKLQGVSLRDHAPTIWRGLAIVRTNPADGFHTTMGLNGEMLEAVQRKLPLLSEDKVLLEKWGDYIVKKTPRRRAAEQQAVMEYLKNHPAYQTFYAFDLETGAEPWKAQVLYTCGLHNPATPPTFNPHTGELYTLYRTAMTNYLRGIRRYSALGRLNRETGRIDFSWPQTPQKDWNNFPMIGDETQSLSLMGHILIGTHQGELGALNLETTKQNPIWRGRDTYGGIFGPGALSGTFEEAREKAQDGYLTGMPNEWHGPDRSIISIGYQRLFWVVGSQVVCLGGPEVPRTDTGGTKPPPLLKSKLPLVQGGNMVHSTSKYDSSLPKFQIPAEEIRKIVSRLPATTSQNSSRSQLSKDLQTQLDRAMLELIEGDPWAPFIVELGIMREDRYFWRTAETMQIIAQALPYLSESVRKKATVYLDTMFQNRMPLVQAVHEHVGRRRREMYQYGPGMENFAKRRINYKPNIEDLYAVWAYAHYASAWDNVLPQLPTIRRLYQEFSQSSFTFDHTDNRNDAAEHLNRQIAGVIGYLRILQKADLSEETKEPWDHLTMMVNERVHHERADSGLIRASVCWGHGNDSHNAKIPRYVGLTPELTAILSQYTGETFRDHVTGLSKQLPLWYQAWGERMIGGENYISPPHLARGLFTALAQGQVYTADQMHKYLDQPWCKADLYYIEKLTLIIRNLSQ
jgi:putative pyrroloquinoline-quinone binding quinoprotein